MLSFIWNEIHFAYYWKFFAFNARSFFISFHIVYIQKITRLSANCTSCKNAASASLDLSPIRANRFNSDISPDIVAHPTSIQRWRPSSSAFTSEASFEQNNAEIALKSKGFLNERCHDITTETRTTSVYSMGFKRREGELPISWKWGDSILRREKIDGTFLCAQCRWSTAGIFQLCVLLQKSIRFKVFN